jgi:hypothetical protein
VAGDHAKQSSSLQRKKVDGTGRRSASSGKPAMAPNNPPQGYGKAFRGCHAWLVATGHHGHPFPFASLPAGRAAPEQTGRLPCHKVKRPLNPKRAKKIAKSAGTSHEEGGESLTQRRKASSHGLNQRARIVGARI